MDTALGDPGDHAVALADQLLDLDGERVERGQLPAQALGRGSRLVGLAMEILLWSTTSSVMNR